MLILLAHLAAFVVPSGWQYIQAIPVSLYAVELTGLALALIALFAIALLIVRRIWNRQLWNSTSAMDWLLLIALLTQVALGFWTAYGYRWGAAWYLYTATPWLRSIFVFQPRTERVTALPVVVQLHFLFGFFVIALFPFTRLVHIVTFPITYL